MKQKQDDNSAVLRITGWLCAIVGLCCLIAAGLFRNSPSAQKAEQLSEANQKLRDGDSPGAYEAYCNILETDPGNTDALEGIMQIAYDSGNTVLLTESFAQWQECMIATGRLDDIRMEQMADVVDDVERREMLEEVAVQIEKGENAQAQLLLEAMPKAYMDEELVRLQIKLLCGLADEALKKGDISFALEELQKAEEWEVPDEELEAKLLYTSCLNIVNDIREQDYTLAQNLLEKCEEKYGTALMEKYRSQLEEATDTDALLQESMSALEQPLKKNETEKIIALLQDKDFLEAGSRIEGRICSENVKKKDGEGLALYHIDGRVYVYCGSFANGMRNGSGIWCYSDGEGLLCRYELEWVDDIPEGKGRCDRYRISYVQNAFTTSNAKQIGHEADEFTLKAGVMDGAYHTKYEHISEYPYEYTVDYKLQDGYCPQIFEEDYPEVIQDYLPYPMPLAGWAQTQVYDPVVRQNYTTTVWFNWSTQRRTVEGVDAAPAQTGIAKLSSIYPE